MFDMPAKPPILKPDGEPMPCPVCGRIFERPLVVDGKEIGGHPIGDPRFCTPLKTVLPRVERDARKRRSR